MANKWTDGWLCRDKDDCGVVVFFPSPCRMALSLDGQWRVTSDRFVATAEWTYCVYRRRYDDLTPPAKGEKFYVSIQL